MARPGNNIDMQIRPSFSQRTRNRGNSNGSNGHCIKEDWFGPKWFRSLEKNFSKSRRICIKITAEIMLIIYAIFGSLAAAA